VITGGANGIGWSVAKLFLAEGCRVAIWDRAAPSELESWPSSAKHTPARVRHDAVDVTDESSLSSARDRTLEDFGRIDHVVHAAAIGSGKFGFPFTNLSPRDWMPVLQVNILGMVNVAHCLEPILRDQQSGSMTFIGSIAGQIGSQTDPPYSASKAANINFMQCLAKDLAKFNVRANIVNPGMVKTTLNQHVWQAWHDQQPLEKRQSYEEWAQAKIQNVIPLGRWQTSDDIANAVVFLASPRASNITGQCINVDGGCVMHA
jgi:NAD(P)-dependent dehydrogenase (short-subunit alcohol dehydrogenase family)